LSAALPSKTITDRPQISKVSVSALHSGGITLLTICGLTHREAYGDIAVVAVLIPAIALVIVIVLGTLFGSF